MFVTVTTLSGTKEAIAPGAVVRIFDRNDSAVLELMSGTEVELHPSQGSATVVSSKLMAAALNTTERLQRRAALRDVSPLVVE